MTFFLSFCLGLNLLIPVLDKVKYVQSLKEIAIDIPQQAAISSGQILPFSTSSLTVQPVQVLF
jgi:hypothetical protein